MGPFSKKIFPYHCRSFHQSFLYNCLGFFAVQFSVNEESENKLKNKEKKFRFYFYTCQMYQARIWISNIMLCVQ